MTLQYQFYIDVTIFYNDIDATVFYSGHSLIEAFDNCRASNGNIQRQAEKRIGSVFKSEKKKYKMLHKCFSFTISVV